MADDVAVTPGSGAGIATDEIGARHFQWFKLALGGVDAWAPAPGDGTDGLRVQHRGDSTATGTITASGQSVTAAVGTGMQSVTFAYQGTHAGITVNPEASFDGGSTYHALLSSLASVLFASGTLATTRPVGANASEFLSAPIPAGATHVRLRASAYTSGTMNVYVGQKAAPSPTQSVQVPTGTVAADTELAAAVARADGFANPTAPSVGAELDGFNGTTWDRWRNTFSQTALASAARTATNSSADIVNYNGRTVQAVLNVTSAGTGSIITTIEGKDSISNAYYALNANPAAVTANGTYVYEIGPGAAATGGITQRTAGVIPRTVRVTVTHGNANSITYSVSLVLGV